MYAKVNVKNLLPLLKEKYDNILNKHVQTERVAKLVKMYRFCEEVPSLDIYVTEEDWDIITRG